MLQHVATLLQHVTTLLQHVTTLTVTTRYNSVTTPFFFKGTRIRQQGGALWRGTTIFFWVQSREKMV